MERLSPIDIFVTVVKEQSFASAAERLGISLQVIDDYISELEDFLGLSLFQKDSEDLALTQDGIGYYVAL